MTRSARPRPLVLAVLDGLGERAEGEANAVHLAQTPHLDALGKRARSTLAASGAALGLLPGRPGSSEHGHLCAGAGRVGEAYRSPIDAAIAQSKLRANEAIDRAFTIALHNKCRLHLFSLVSGGGLHASLDHLYALIEAAHFEEIPVVVHAFLDGREGGARSAGEKLGELSAFLEGKGIIGTVAGRAYAMDRGGRWDRVFKAYSAIVRGQAPRVESAFEALREAYARGLDDERFEPVRVGDYEGLKGDFMADFSVAKPVWEWLGEEVGIGVNFRPDRMRQLAGMLTRRNVPAEAIEMLTERGKPVTAFPEESYICLTEYDAALKLPVAFPRGAVEGSFGEALSRAGLRQLRCSEQEKHAHVTTFFNGGREEPFEGEERRLVPSLRDVESYADKPEMSAPLVAEEVVRAIEGGSYDFILVNFANPDAVAHTGKLDAAVKAVEAVDAAVGSIMRAVEAAGGALFVTSAHGNCEEMSNERGEPHTGHTQNPVPLYYANFGGEEAALQGEGALSDVAPTMLDLLGIPKPEAMTGKSLFIKSS